MATITKHPTARKYQANFRISKLAQMQLEQLVSVLGVSRTELLTLAIDRLWHDCRKDPEDDIQKIEFPY